MRFPRFFVCPRVNFMRNGSSRRSPQRSAGRQTGVLDLSHPVVTTGGCVGISVNTNTAAVQSTKAHMLTKLTLDLLASKGAGAWPARRSSALSIKDCGKDWFGFFYPASPEIGRRRTRCVVTGDIRRQSAAPSYRCPAVSRQLVRNAPSKYSQPR